MVQRTADVSQTAQIIIWFLFVVAVFSVGAGVGTKYALLRRFGWDDRLMLLALVMSLAQCIAISLAASQGIGKDMSTLTDDAISGFLKAGYASVPFQILTFAVVKWSITIFIEYLTPDDLHLYMVLGIRVTISLWTISGILSGLFQCALPTPWNFLNGARCIDRRAWWTYIGALNIATEVAIIVLYLLILWDLHISHSRKVFVLSIFLSRVLVIAAVIAQLVIFHDSYSDPDVTESSWLPIILDQVVICVSILTACLPFMKPFMESLQSGIVRVETVVGSQEELSHNRAGSSAYYLTDFSNSAACSHPSNGSTNRSTNRSIP
ncbi:uncharacterized protein GGS22DRAFT_187576 [Annulohypoxylon maeteangense]|uniref:uncharacterized protein n=1 Tax=Annulohypoxylon maeteangense TaxID=1927788 RepID=UPI0020086025|nr:uncharacterized protein GGS22DRAFT_187576 [Annulohypoxylon maeteangense]KAI0886337.1 hypothetical protein GGS22DRAFT_187576 [Annulohypoxylon maeteangense]